MRKYELREKELIIAYHAMNLLMLHIPHVQEHWTQADIAIAAALTEKLRTRRNRIVRGAPKRNAANID